MRVEIPEQLVPGEEHYDAGADLMYFSWPSPQRCVCVEPMPGVLCKSPRAEWT